MKMVEINYQWLIFIYLFYLLELVCGYSDSMIVILIEIPLKWSYLDICIIYEMSLDNKYKSLFILSSVQMGDNRWNCHDWMIK